MPPEKPPVYERLMGEISDEPSSSLDEPLLPSSLASNETIKSGQTRVQSLPRYLLFVNLTLFCTSLAIMLGSLIYVHNLTHNVNNSLLKKTSVYTPLFDKLNMPLQTIRTNGSFFPQNPPSIFQQPPSPEVDAAWDRISDTHAIVLTREEIIKLGRDPAEQWPWPKEYGLGDNAYMGLLDVFHQLHCLNSLRQAAYPEHYYHATNNSEATHHLFHRGDHNLHCQYILLQFILCHADMSVITFNKVEDVRGPFADFSIDHKCRDFDRLYQWKLDHQVNVTDEEWELIKITPAGIREMPGEGRSRPV